LAAAAAAAAGHGLRSTAKVAGGDGKLVEETRVEHAAPLGEERRHVWRMARLDRSCVGVLGHQIVEVGREWAGRAGG
jgi:hypothetical protein